MSASTVIAPPPQPVIAVAGWQVWRHDSSGLPMKLWWAQLVLNFLWSPTFFAAPPP